MNAVCQVFEDSVRLSPVNHHERTDGDHKLKTGGFLLSAFLYRRQISAISF